MAVEIELMPIPGDTVIVIADARRLVGGTVLTLFMAAGWGRAVQAR